MEHIYEAIHESCITSRTVHVPFEEYSDKDASILAGESCDKQLVHDRDGNISGVRYFGVTGAGEEWSVVLATATE